ncbi:MAG: putative membrane protein YkoS [Methanomicrobiales archaeon 53_19]|uniref:DUF6044 family protein n=1 Tax=Methanocalculus sp. TaxID=2004547 RepID=UPI00074AA386|nr:DUF6044 family protein [Methanocalculus sp.]KUK70520.1 MAG: putative membrane protein YkoS [Methanocalculus sp. 52_23]KUL02968.1 MAG: putative membrane protein YkoS [Methanomicrobiales archaeon 53_19]HIJ05694.1 hypothetical protein [Methanocalculus sp.]
MQAQDFFKEYRYIIIALVVLALYLAPFYIMGEDTPTLVHDNLDSNVIFFTVLSHSGQTFGSMDATIPQIMNGIPRNSFGSEFNVIQWFYLFFEPYTAYIINLTLMHIIAFIGMYLLLSRHILKEEATLIVVGVSLAFALLPFWPSGGLSVAGMPLLLFAFLNIRSGQLNAIDWVIVGLMPLYSSFALTGFFVLVALSVFWLYDLIVTRKPNFYFFIAIGLLCLVYCLVEYRLFISMFLDTGYISHRVEFAQGFVPLDFGSALQQSVKNFFLGQYHAASLHTYFIGLCTAIACLILFIKKKRCDLFFILIGLCVLISLFYGFISSEYLLFIRSFPLFHGFNLGRFHFLHPLLWFIIFALALAIIHSHRPHGKQIASILLILQITFLFTCAYVAIGGEYQYGGPVLFLTSQYSWEEFYSPGLFSEIDETISLPKDSYRVVSIGMHPAISQYNGFYTLDGYQANYPLEYKHSFRRIIEKELDKSEKFQEYFDYWGSRCYVFSSELEDNHSMNTKDNPRRIENLEINSDALYEMGGRYVFSAVEILNCQENNLVLLDVFEREDSPWRIWVYSVKPS